MSKTETPSIELTVDRTGGQFKWTSSSCALPDCPVQVAPGDNAKVTVAISDPNGPHSGPQQVTFSSYPILVSPAKKPEIHGVSGMNTNTLVFQDHNFDLDTLKYALTFNNAPPIDPIIQNGGGGPPTSEFLPTSVGEFAVDLAVVFLVGLIAAFVARRFLALRRARHSRAIS